MLVTLVNMLESVEEAAKVCLLLCPSSLLEVERWAGEGGGGGGMRCTDVLPRQVCRVSLTSFGFCRRTKLG